MTKQPTRLLERVVRWVDAQYEGALRHRAFEVRVRRGTVINIAEYDVYGVGMVRILEMRITIGFVCPRRDPTHQQVFALVCHVAAAFRCWDDRLYQGVDVYRVPEGKLFMRDHKKLMREWLHEVD